jgi:protein-L-isoaspartate O-methyltransferase
VIQAFRHVDRGFFVPPEHRGSIYEDRPFRQELGDGEGALHMSAPHMYASVLEHLEMEPGSGHSFLNIGSGTGYLSSLAAFLVGTDGSVHSIEVFPKVVEWAKQKFAEFGAVPLIPGLAHHGRNRDVLARDFKFVEGNALAIDVRPYPLSSVLIPHPEQEPWLTPVCRDLHVQVEHNCKYDRIYVGAQGVDADVRFLMRLLKPGGVLVGPFSDKLLRVRRSDDGEKFTSEQISGVRFTQLVRPTRGDRAVVQSAAEAIEKEKVKALCAACGDIDASMAKGLLQKASWEVDKATEAYLSAKAAEEATPPAAATNVPEGDPAKLSRQSSQVSVESWLAQVKLERYSAAIKEQGYDELLFLKDAHEDDIDEMLTDIKMKKPHARTFKKAWQLLLEVETAQAGGGAQADAASELAVGGASGPTEGHGNMQHGFSLGASVATRSDGKKLFGSVRYKDGRIMPEALQLQSELRSVGLDLTLVDMTAGGDIDTNVFGGIEKADTFVVFGTADYGQNTGNPACTYYESKFALTNRKRIILLRMIPYGAQFEELQARQLFGVNKLSLEWIQGCTMPPSLVSDIVKAVNDPSTAPRSR